MNKNTSNRLKALRIIFLVIFLILIKAPLADELPQVEMRTDKGTVILGLEVADEISRMEKMKAKHIGLNVPAGPVIIEEMRAINHQEELLSVCYLT